MSLPMTPVDRDVQVARKLALLHTMATTLRRENEDLKRRLKITQQFVPVQSQKSLEAALGEGGTW